MHSAFSALYCKLGDKTTCVRHCILFIAAPIVCLASAPFAQAHVISTSRFFLMIEDPCATEDQQGPTWCEVLRFRLIRKSDCKAFKLQGRAVIHYCAGNPPKTPCQDLGGQFDFGSLSYRVNGLDVWATDKQGHEVFHEAGTFIRTKSSNPTFQWIGNKCALSGVDSGSELQAGLFGAIERNDPIAVQTSLQQGANVNGADADGWTPVLRASTTSGSAETIRILMSKGADLGVRDPFGRSPAILAAWSGDVEVLQLLIGGGADVNATDKKGESALIAAARRGNAKQVMPLLRAGAAADYADPQGRTALSYAFEAHRYGSGAEPDPWACVRFLLRAGASLDRRDSNGIAPFRYIARSGRCAPVDTELVQSIASRVPAQDVEEVVMWASNRRSEPKNCDVLAETLKKARPQ